jgi:DNA-binding XRE family transcriptional regulator
MLNKIKKFLIRLNILQELASKIGASSESIIRLNPYNPLSYITFVCIVIYGIFKYGFFDCFRYLQNPFKWQDLK